MHIPVLLASAVRLWTSLDKYAKVKSGLYIDATFGKGGHSNYLLAHPAKEKNVIVVGIERDSKQYRNSHARYQKEIKNKKLFLYNENFANISAIISSFQNKYKQKLPVRGILFDLGICTDHLRAGRGFSFQERNDPLDMRFESEEKTLTAADILNSWRAEELEEIFKEYGEEKYSRKVAKAIVFSRQKKNFFTTVADLLKILEQTLASAYRKQKIHYATRIFQALRVTVNDEYKNIEQGLADSLKILDKQGRIVAISFHSGEDRIVKNFFRSESKDCLCGPNIPRCVCGHQKSLQIITRKPLGPDPEEIKRNPNARSAKLRAAEKILNFKFQTSNYTVCPQ